MTEAEQIALARERLQALGACAWAVVREKGGRFLEARMRSGQFLRIADFDPGATDAEVAFIEHAPRMVRLMSDLVARAAAKVRALTREVERLRDELAALRASSPVPKAAGAPVALSQGEEAGSVPEAPDTRQEGKNYAAEAAIKCGEPAFRRFLAERHGLVQDNDDAAAACLRAALGIASRKLLNTDPEAAARWREMRRAFENWGRG